MNRISARGWLGAAVGLVAVAALIVGLIFVLARERGAENVWAKTPSQDRAEPLRPRDGKNDIGLLPLARDLDQPVALAFVPGTPGLAVVLEKEGTARLLDLRAADDDHPRVVTPSSIVFEVPVRSVSEMGLLGIAFHPQYEKNGRFFINYNPASGAPRTVIAEWRLPLSDVGQRRATFVRNLLEVEQPYANHGGGHLAFGPDGYLYIGLGDGGAANDPHGHGQNLGTLLGAMLRLNVDAAELPYAIPPDNPFIDTAGARAEIWAYGLRNPWRFSFDPQGRLIAGDVGQNAYEEIDIITRGANLGWNIREARHCFQAGHVAPVGSCTTHGLRDPIFEYGRELGSSVTGGNTYRGRRVPALKDRYVFGDYVSGQLWSLKVAPDGRSSTDVRRHGRFDLNPVAFVPTRAGEIILVEFRTGALFRLMAL